LKLLERGHGDITANAPLALQSLSALRRRNVSQQIGMQASAFRWHPRIALGHQAATMRLRDVAFPTCSSCLFPCTSRAAFPLGGVLV